MSILGGMPENMEYNTITDESEIKELKEECEQFLLKEVNNRPRFISCADNDGFWIDYLPHVIIQINSHGLAVCLFRVKENGWKVKT